MATEAELTAALVSASEQLHAAALTINTLSAEIARAMTAVALYSRTQNALFLAARQHDPTLADALFTQLRLMMSTPEYQEFARGGSV